jgi:ankyrin repeat protein
MTASKRPPWRIALLALCVLLFRPAGGRGQEPAVPDRAMITAEMFAAAARGDLQTVRSLLAKHPDLKDARREGGWTLLHVAGDNRELVEYLIASGADIKARSDGQWTPLHNQAYKGNLDAVELLLAHGADIEARTSFGMTPLLSSLRWDRLAVTKFLVEKGANVNPTTELGRTPLIISAVEGNPELARLFLDNGADIEAKDQNYKRTALHFAALYGQLDIVDALLKKGAHVDERDGAGKTPLDYAARYGHEKVAQRLKASGAAGEIDPAHFGFSPVLTQALKEGEACAWYMGHAGYALKTKNLFLLFNYSHGSGAGNPDEPRLANGRISLEEIADCRVIVFAGSPHHSHHHPERFSQWQKTHKNIVFIFSFEDKTGRNPNYFKDVEGPTYVHLPDGEKRDVQGVKVETIPVSGFGPRGSGFLVEVDGLVIFYGGHHLLGDESQGKAFREPIDDLKKRGVNIDLLILPGNFALGRIFPANLEGVEYAVKTLKPRAFLASGGDSTEFVLLQVAAALKKYKEHTSVFCPEHRGDMFHYSREEAEASPPLRGPYLGQKPPGRTPEIFAPGIVSTRADEYALEVSKNGNEILFIRDDTIMLARRNADGAWKPPVVAPFSGKHVDGEPCYSPDGRRIFFASRRPRPNSKLGRNIWVSARKEGIWGPAVPFEVLPWDKTVHAMSIAANGNVYEDGIIRFRFSDGKYRPAERLSPPLKGMYPYVAPDESYIVLSYRPPGKTDADLFASFRRPDGSWTPPALLGGAVNSREWEGNSFVTADGRFLFFSRRMEIYWVSAGVLDGLRPRESTGK